MDGVDTDLPTRFEALFLDSVLGKCFFCTFQLLFYAIRPMMVKQKPLTSLHYFNLIAQFAFDYLLYTMYGSKPLVYLLLSSFLAGSLHPCASHFIGEHYTINKPISKPDSQIPLTDTYSHYGWLNLLCYNVGYHNEHHDVRKHFPRFSGLFFFFFFFFFSLFYFFFIDITLVPLCCMD